MFTKHILAIFGIWEFCHKNKVCDVTSVALLTAAALTSPDRNFVRHQSSVEDRVQMDFVHTNIVSALQNHLIKTVSTSVVSFAKGLWLNFKYIALTSNRWLLNCDAHLANLFLILSFTSEYQR